MTRILTIALIAVCAWILPAQGQTVDKGLASRMDPAGLRELYQICRHTTLSVRQQEKLAELLEECSAEFKDALLGNDGFLTLEDEKRLEKMRDKALRATLSEAQLLEYFRYLCVPEATRAGHEARDIVSGQLKLTYMEKKYINNTFYAKSFVQYLKESGYHTIHCGKAHWGAIDTPGENPSHFGFEVNISGHAAGGLASYLGEERYGHDSAGNPVSPMAVPGLEKYWDTDTFVTEALTVEAIKALDKAKAYGQPFYLYMSHYAVHIPIDRDARYFDKYKQKGMSDKEAAYASLIEGMDKSLGDIMDWLERNGEADNTIILFMGDNGGYATGKHWRDEPLYTQNSPLKCGKGSAYEGGIREPMIVYWPGVTVPGSRCGSYVMIEDYYPTILEMAGIEYKDAPQQIDGRSFVPLLRQNGDPSKGRSLYWNYPNLWGETGPGIGASCTVMDGEWKLIYFYETGRKELYNIVSDIGESEDLSSSRPDIVKKLSGKLGRFLRSAKAQRPTFKSTGLPCPWPDEI